VSRLRRWAGAFFGGRDVFFRADDPGPFLGQFAALASLSRRARRNRLSLVEASTLDIEWNGDP
jgi:hypothetical protein